MAVIAIVLFFVGFLLTSCTTTIEKAGEKKIDVSRKALDYSMWEICEGASIGAVKEYINRHNIDENIYKQLCNDRVDVLK